MRKLIPALMLFCSACSAYPDIDWPAGPAAPAPELLPQAALGAAAPARDSGPGVAARAAALRLWARGVQAGAAQP